MTMWTVGVINGDKYGGYHQTPYRVARGGETRSAALRSAAPGISKNHRKIQSLAGIKRTLRPLFRLVIESTMLATASGAYLIAECAAQPDDQKVFLVMIVVLYNLIFPILVSLDVQSED